MKMLYIHTLKDLTPKAADIECVPLIREIKRDNKFPILVDRFQQSIIQLFPSKQDLTMMQQTMEDIPSIVNEIKKLAGDEELFEAINLQRAVTGLEEIPPQMQSSMKFAEELLELKDKFGQQAVTLLNKIPSLRSQEEKIEHNARISEIFEMLLRNKSSFAFNFEDVVNEGQTSRMNSLADSMAKGFFFRVKLEEHLKNKDFSAIKSRVPQEMLARVDSIAIDMKGIQKAVQRAYDINMNMLTLSVLLYAYIKWVSRDIAGII